jgi:hypothetical protein
MGFLDAPGKAQAHVIGPAHEVVFVTYVVVPEHAVQELGSVVKLRVIAIADLEIDVDSAVSDPCSVAGNDIGGLGGG